jgi:hypothetical protein
MLMTSTDHHLKGFGQLSEMVRNPPGKTYCYKYGDEGLKARDVYQMHMNRGNYIIVVYPE